jgi:hypothetical protein
MLGMAAAGPVARASGASGASRAACSLGAGSSAKHVIYIQFDNTHYSRDQAHVPSDLEQMPNLLNFITGNGTLISHEHTPLIAHTANDIVTSETGLYPSGHGLAVANTYNYYTPSGSTDTAGDFAYWTDPIVDYSTATGAPVGDSTHNLVTSSGANTPAPWVAYTRAGCDFGSVAAANTEIENTTPDVPLLFGAKSPQAKEAENPKLQNKAVADFEGLSVHCARTSSVCAHGGVADSLPAEPGGYHGYKALFGNTFVQPVISPSGPVRNLDGQVIKDTSGDVGFPGYNGMSGTNGLAYTLYMQTHGIPVTYTYLTDLHDNYVTGAGMGSGTAVYERQLRAENAAFGTFFARLAAAGITKANSLFVFTSDEGDHFVGSPPSPSSCDGVTVTCSYQRVGEVDGNLTGMLAARGVKTPFDVAADSAPILYVHGQPSRTAGAVRTLERTAYRLSAADLATGKTVRLTQYLADPVELGLLHMVTGDAHRTPTVALFANPDFWLSSGSANCGKSCVSEPSGGDAWNHGDVAPAINTTWLGLAGPGVAGMGVDGSLWSDHTDINPTMMALLGLHDDYAPDGRVLAEVFTASARPAALRSSYPAVIRLGQVYTQLEAAVGSFGLSTLAASTRALASSSPGDAVYTSLEHRLGELGAVRDALASRMRALLLGAAFDGKPVPGSSAAELITAGQALLAQARALG